jgi:transcriptional regulator with XRE-family HTH domain
LDFGPLNLIGQITPALCHFQQGRPVPRIDYFFGHQNASRREVAVIAGIVHFRVAPRKADNMSNDMRFQKGPPRNSKGANADGKGPAPELVSRIENGAANPELDTLGKVADAFGVHPRELLEE